MFTVIIGSDLLCHSVRLCRDPLYVNFLTVGNSWLIWKIFCVTRNLTSQKVRRCIAHSKNVNSFSVKSSLMSHYLENTNTLQLCMSLVHTVCLQFLVSLSPCWKPVRWRGSWWWAWGGYTGPCTNEKSIHEKSMHVLHEVASKAPYSLLDNTADRWRN